MQELSNESIVAILIVGAVIIVLIIAIIKTDVLKFRINPNGASLQTSKQKSHVPTKKATIHKSSDTIISGGNTESNLDIKVSDSKTTNLDFRDSKKK